MRLNFKKGASSAICFLASAWLMILAIIFFMESYNLFSNAGKTQIFADVISDGSCFLANNGWGLDQNVAKQTKDKIVKANKETFKDIKFDKDGFKLLVTDKNNKPVTNQKVYLDHNKPTQCNTVMVKSISNIKMLSDAKLFSDVKTPSKKSDGAKVQKTSATKLNYSGGLKIVREAWTHTYDYHIHEGGVQTPYVWGGGHGTGDGTGCLINGADCSGFVSAVFRKCGYASIVGESTTAGLKNCGRFIAKASDPDSACEYARPGDIIIYYTGGVDKHTGIYAGKYNGVHYQIHCSSGGTNHLLLTAENAQAGNAAGPGIGCILAPVSNFDQIEIRRIVDSAGRGEEVKNPPPHLAGGIGKLDSILYEAGYSKTARAAILGNWFVESGGEPTMREEKAGNRAACDEYADMIRRSVYGKNGKSYVGNGRSGIYTKADFVNEGIGQMSLHRYSEGYGIAQWTTTNLANPMADRKAKLWDHATAMGSDVTDVWVQVTFAVKEMSEMGFGPDWMKNGGDVNEATKDFLLRYEGVNIALEDRQTAANIFKDHLL